MSRQILRRWPDLKREKKLCRQGFRLIAGLDEAGRGAWAGPLTAAAVVLPLENKNLRRLLHQVRDSKQMSAKERAEADAIIRKVAIAFYVGMSSAAEVDRLGPLRATHLAMHRALQGLPAQPDHLLIDFLRLPDTPIPQTQFPHGDAISLSIAAASVLAKVRRDAIMTHLEESYPEFHFAQHKGYGTRLHQSILEQLGPCPEHRKSYAPVRCCETRSAQLFPEAPV